MTEKPHQEKGTLVLALIAGLSVNGAFAALFSSIVPFSIFPLIALVLSIYCLHERYLHHSMPEGIPILVAASFLLGLLIYSAIVRVEYPAIGSNFIPSILCVALVFWIGLKLRRRKATEPVAAEESETL
ncbi:membrane protein [Pectobacterium araliae]|uniref:YijD family membrane protein n=1 Tax=Pectobacterium araliae TaxID=3073862 RepID=A0AAN0KKB9_9GAMM|nr:YijD family membrane protein [Pectobacterium sp. MAFF 302110]GKW21547.1 membrane protein [Pectobacterium carotovorum subsp. carotovorum]